MNPPVPGSPQRRSPVGYMSETLAGMPGFDPWSLEIQDP